MKYSNMIISNVSGIPEFSAFFLYVSELLHPRNASVNCSFHRRGPQARFGNCKCFHIVIVDTNRIEENEGSSKL